MKEINKLEKENKNKNEFEFNLYDTNINDNTQINNTN